MTLLKSTLAGCTLLALILGTGSVQAAYNTMGASQGGLHKQATVDVLISRKGADDAKGAGRRGRGRDDGAKHAASNRPQPWLLARRGADDPVGHVRRGRGADDAKGAGRRGRGKDDAAGDDRGRA
ncbi:hypothetical protein [Ensifer soli]|uniref:hypothetical protein n=1 Tax=Ciceribacter sp. sgz301302 TaxID=3342379 RepID=UPI0035B8FF99